MGGSKLRVALLLLFVCAAGFAGGVAAERLWLDEGQADVRERERGPDARQDRERDRTVIERFAEELELTAAQRARIDTILDHYRDHMKEMWSEFRPRYRATVDSVRRRIEDVLEPEQTRRYRSLLEERFGDGGDRRDGERRESSEERQRGNDGEERR